MPNTNGVDLIDLIDSDARRVWTLIEFVDLVAAVANNNPTFRDAASTVESLDVEGIARLLIYRRAVRAKFYTDEGV